MFRPLEYHREHCRDEERAPVVQGQSQVGPVDLDLREPEERKATERDRAQVAGLRWLDHVHAP